VSLESLDAQLISKALEKREYILGQARKEAERIKAQAQAEVERIKEMTNAAIENILKGEARAVYDRIVGGAQLEGRKKVMNARLQVINQVFDRARDELDRLTKSQEYPQILVALASEAIEALDEDCIVYANENDAEYLKTHMELLPINHTVKIEHAPFDIEGGVTVVSMDGSKTMENTLEGRFEARREFLIPKVAEILEVI